MAVCTRPGIYSSVRSTSREVGRLWDPASDGDNESVNETWKTWTVTSAAKQISLTSDSVNKQLIAAGDAAKVAAGGGGIV